MDGNLAMANLFEFNSEKEEQEAYEYFLKSKKGYREFKDTIHGFTALGKSKNTAWMLIRNKCHELNLEVPTMDKIVEAE